jgi:hypothetical protein
MWIKAVCAVSCWQHWGCSIRALPSAELCTGNADDTAFGYQNEGHYNQTGVRVQDRGQDGNRGPDEMTDRWPPNRNGKDLFTQPTRNSSVKSSPFVAVLCGKIAQKRCDHSQPAAACPMHSRFHVARGRFGDRLHHRIRATMCSRKH